MWIAASKNCTQADALLASADAATTTVIATLSTVITGTLRGTFLFPVELAGVTMQLCYSHAAGVGGAVAEPWKGYPFTVQVSIDIFFT